MEIDNRELLRQVMEIKERIRDLSKEEQKEILTNKIAEIRRCLTIIPMSFEKYGLSSRQREVERLSLLESNNPIDSYWEMYDFIVDYGDNKNGRVFVEEIEELEKMLNNLEIKIARNF